METKVLLKLSLIVALISIFIIIVLADTLEPKTIEIREINEHQIDNWVKIRGEVIKQRSVDSLTILTIYDGTASIKAVLRKKVQNLESLSVIIIGQVIDYKGELEIEISDIKIENK
ncbi:MAG: hypothetical protein N3G19_03905 [Candidatus Pacearchaeota archaeon]|nr:hypothetical protein [Candidatus Pacearchaeota archaeon]